MKHFFHFVLITIFLVCTLSCVHNKEEYTTIKEILPETVYQVDYQNAANIEKYNLIQFLSDYYEKQIRSYINEIQKDVWAKAIILETSWGQIGLKRILDNYQDSYNSVVLDISGVDVWLCERQTIKDNNSQALSDVDFAERILGAPSSKTPSLDENSRYVLIKNQLLSHMPPIEKWKVKKLIYLRSEKRWQATMENELILKVEVEEDNNGKKQYLPIFPDGYVIDSQ